MFGYYIKKINICLIILFISLNGFAQTTPIPGINTDSQNFLGGIVRAQFSAGLSTDAAGSLNIEAGSRNYRADGTFGFKISPFQQLKITGEYLRQDIDYDFSTGTTRQWVQQGAAGLDYQHHLTENGLNYLDIIGYYSHAPSKTLDPILGSYTDSANNLIEYTNARRIAGSNAYGISPTLTMNPWYGGQATLAVNYDHVHYDNMYITEQQSDGFGGTAALNQQLGNNLQVSISAGVRAPFNTYQGAIRYIVPDGNLSIGIIGNYTDGKNDLPDTSVAGVELTYTIDKERPAFAQLTNRNYPSITAWTQQPAVYMPQVLAIPEQGLLKTNIPLCIPPVFSGSIPNQAFPNSDSTVNLSTAAFFSGTNLVFSASNLPNYLSINSATGVISGSLRNPVFKVVVIATNSCGTAQSNQFNLIFNQEDS